MKQPTEIIEAALPATIQYGRGIAAGEIVQALRREGWIVVRKGAIGAAQREAVAQYREDNEPANDNDPVAAHMRRKA